MCTCWCLWRNVAWVCAHLGFIVHNVSGVSNHWSGIWGGKWDGAMGVANSCN